MGRSGPLVSGLSIVDLISLKHPKNFLVSQIEIRVD